MYFLAFKITIAGATKYIPTFSKITPIPYPKTSESDSAYSMTDSDDSNGVIPSFTASLNAGFSLSKSAIVGENEFGGSGNGEGEFDLPSGLALQTDNDMLYIADTDNNKIQIIDVDGNCSGSDELADDVCFVDEFGGSGNGEGEFNNPSGLTLDISNDILYIADTDNDRIQIIDVDGNCSGSDELADDVCFVDEFGELGDGDEEFKNLSALVFHSTDDLLFVADTDNDRIQAFELVTASAVLTLPAPENLQALPSSISSIIITWKEPVLAESIPAISGYKIEYRVNSGNYETIIENTASVGTSFLHQGLDTDDKYTYRVYAINSKGTSVASSTDSAKPSHTTTPTALTATAISPSQIKLSWLAPSNTYNLPISGYEIRRAIISEVFEDIGTTTASTTTFTVNNLATDKTKTYVVAAKLGGGSYTGISNSASATPREDSTDTTGETTIQSAVKGTISTPPIKLVASVVSSTQVNLEWGAPGDDGNTPITGYKIEFKKDSDTYETLVADSKSTTRSYLHTDLVTKSKYTYQVSAINSAGISEPSNEISATPMLTGIKISPMGKLNIDEGKLLSFTVKITDSAIKDTIFRLENNPPGTKIVANTGMFTWTPSSSDGGKSYRFDIVAIKDATLDRQSITITVNDSIKDSQSAPEPKELGIASFVDESKNPQSYVDRYNSEASYKKWFDDNYSEYDSIYQAVGLEEQLEILASFVDESKNPQSYVDRYNSEASYKKWFDDNYSEYDSIYQAVGLEEPKAEEQKTVPKVKEKKFGICGPGTKLIEGVCTIVEKPIVKPWWQFW